MTVVVIMGKNQVLFYVAFTCFMWIVLLLNTEIIDVNPNDVDLFVKEIYSPGGSDHHAHATFNTSRPITKPYFRNIINQTVGQQLSKTEYLLKIVDFQESDAYLRINQTVRGPALPERGCDSVGIYEINIEYADPFLNITNQTVGQQLEIVYYRHERNKMGKLRFLDVDRQLFLDIGYNKRKSVMFQDPDVVKPDKSVDTFRIVKEAYSPDERDIKIHYTSCSNTAHTRLKGKEPNSIFECISVVILWCAFYVIWITYYMQDRQAVTHKKLSLTMLTDMFSKKGGLWFGVENYIYFIKKVVRKLLKQFFSCFKGLTGTAGSVLNETSGGLVAQPTNDILNIQSDDIILRNVQIHINKT